MRSVALLLVVALAAPADGQLRVTEVMYNPASDDGRWEWIEVYNAGTSEVNLDGWVVDRVGDVAQSPGLAPQVRSTVLVSNIPVSNATRVPAGSVAILYDGAGLGFSPTRFRAAWPLVPAGVPLIGVDGWVSNALTNAPAPPTVAPSLPGTTLGFWPNEGTYLTDVANLGSVGMPDRRVVGVSQTRLSFSYDDAPPWPAATGAASIHLSGAAVSNGASWTVSSNGANSATLSVPTFTGTAANATDIGSPGQVPGGTPSRSGLMLTEVMYDPASITGSTEWEWVEVYNAGPTAIDFAMTPHWLDDDDGPAQLGPNVTSGVVPAGGVAMLFNPAATSATLLGGAWDRPGEPEAWIPVSPWPALANSGDVIGLWSNQAAYAADLAAGASLAGAVTGLVYDDTSPWPSNSGMDSIFLRSLGGSPLASSSWGRASAAPIDPNARRSRPVVAPGGTIDNAGGDVGSPGFYTPAPGGPLVGDYNGDGAVNAADYTLWRDGGPLMNETASPGGIDAADYQAWAANYGAGGAAVTVPEPAGLLATVAALVGAGKFRPRRAKSC
ncbi:MAG: lamin tail domain-containing protein [Lacipirellulaceae bacterium]